MTATTPLTIGQTIQEIRLALRNYIEATYHISHPAIVEQRGFLLDRLGVISQEPYLESTPRYVPGSRFSKLGLPQPADELLRLMSRNKADGGPGLLHDPPYDHQAQALRKAVLEDRSLVVTTGTGSGKTESFLLPILAKLAIEASDTPESFSSPAIRALVLYPMNALVNDQLGRLRLLFGNEGVVDQFKQWGGRPARFARYTSRTLYPGVRTSKKDTTRLRPISRFYVDLLNRADGTDDSAVEAQNLIRNLQERGKWPAKPDLRAWFGQKGSNWQRDGKFVRAVMRPDDSELFTRHEVLQAPADVLVTNYSMLEYMLMRPLERPIFDATRDWLENNPLQRLMLVVDEAHLYRGAAGAEVALLIRRLRTRVGIDPDRLQVICTSASFSDKDRARVFAAALSGKDESDFDTIQGTLALKEHDHRGNNEDVEHLADIALENLYSPDQDTRRRAVCTFLRWRGVTGDMGFEQLLYQSLEQYAPMGRLINMTMQEARPVAELAQDVFDTNSARAERALTTLLALGSMARPSSGEPGLLPCRIHTFFRGLPGLWACLDSDCTEVQQTGPSGPIGKLYSQPQESCCCGARVLELYTCRHCGAAYARGYTDNLSEPTFIWSEPGRPFENARGEAHELEAIDICLEQPMAAWVEPHDLDLVTGRLNPYELGDRIRLVYLRRDREADTGDSDEDEKSTTVRLGGEFRPCGVCGQQAAYGRSSVQDHQTKGDQPFQAVISRQIEVQPPGPQPATEFAPLRGRKVLTFSDSRQMAARLAPNLQTYAMRDVLRPLVLLGFRELRQHDLLRTRVGLEDLHLAVMLAARRCDIRLRPELKAGESIQLQRDLDALKEDGKLDDADALAYLIDEAKSQTPPVSLLRGILATVNDKWTGLQSLALGSLAERDQERPKLLEKLPILAPFDSEDQRLALVRLWINQWTAPGLWFPTMPASWWMNEVRGHKGKFKSLTKWFEDKVTCQKFENDWLPILRDRLCEPQGDTFRMRAQRLTLDTSPSWAYCRTCKTTQRPFPGTARCVACCRNDVYDIDPDTDPVFRARKGYYRQSTIRALAPVPEPPTVIVAAEHTAQLGQAQGDAVFSKAEEHELLFQDVDLGGAVGQSYRSAVDVLSCTTTMEVGIDIGALSGVALRNMPPSRANYQQRAGRAGRRGNAVATVIAFGSADSHDEHFFREPDAMIRGPVDDPILSLNNVEIARRHVTAFLLQRYHSDRLPTINPKSQPQLFEVLGTVHGFLLESTPLNRSDFMHWLRAEESGLRLELDSWLPRELANIDRAKILDDFSEHTIQEIDQALDQPDSNDKSVADPSSPPVTRDTTESEDTASNEVPTETGEERVSPENAKENLLDRLLYKGVLPRYAFPTDVVSFHVFDAEGYTAYRPLFQYAPSQGLPIALSQYAPGKEVWIDGKLWTSGALYSPMPSDLFNNWQKRRLYFECSVCRYAKTEMLSDAERDEMRDCPACGAEALFGKARNWVRPPGFAHPHSIPEGTSPDDQPARSYATRAKLIASFPADAVGWSPVTSRIRQYYDRTFLLVTNTGPNHEGYTYCLKCGLIEPTAVSAGKIFSAHAKPFPDRKEPDCTGEFTTSGMVLGTDFVSDVLLMALRVDEPLTLRPNYLSTDVALRTLADAITIAATRRLEIDLGEIQAEYRPALTDLGKDGLEAEIYLYDTLAGGAGFARNVGELGESVLSDALEILEACPAGCDRSCYRCLRSFRNRFEHQFLDRFVGASLLRYLLRDEKPVLDPERIERSTDRLFEDLARQGVEGVKFRRRVSIEIPGVGQVSAPIAAITGDRTVIIGTSGPLTPDYPADTALRDAKKFNISTPVELVDDILISQNLPAASLQVIQRVKGN